MSDNGKRREQRRKRRIRGQILSYGFTAVVLAAVLAGCVLGVRAAAGAVIRRAQEREQSRQAAIEESQAAESQAAEEAVAAMLQEAVEEQETQETESAYSPEEALEELVEESVASLTLEQKVAGLFFVTPEQITGVAQAVQAGDGTREALAKYPVGGLIYSKQNIQSGEQIREMLENTVSYSSFPLFLGIEEEGGKLSPVADALQLDKVDDMADVGASGDAQAAYDAGFAIGSYLSSYGFNLDFAPSADLYAQDSANAARTFSQDAQTQAQLALSAAQGMQAAGVSACLKHFPGQGRAQGDPADGPSETTRTKEEMAAEEFLPFQAAVQGGCDMIMVGHVSASAILGEDSGPASLSDEMITGILRKELGYDGIIITDALNMAAVTQYYESDVAAILALKAGADMVLEPEDFSLAYEGVLEAVQNGTISEERINDSLARIYRVKLRGRISQ